jgi:hypothetical protein
VARFSGGRLALPAAAGGRQAGARWCAQVAVSDETLATALARHLQRVGCHPVVRGQREVVVVLSGPRNLREALVELAFYLGRWRAAERAVRSVSVSSRPVPGG